MKNIDVMKEISNIFGYDLADVYVYSEEEQKRTGANGFFNSKTNTVGVYESLSPAYFAEVLLHEKHHELQVESGKLKIDTVEINTYMYGETYKEVEIEAVFDGEVYDQGRLNMLKYINWPWEVEAREVARELLLVLMANTSIEELKEDIQKLVDNKETYEHYRN